MGSGVQKTIPFLLFLVLTFACGGPVPSGDADSESEEIVASGFAEPEELVEVSGSTADPDTTPPDLLEMDFNPKSVDLSTGDQYVTFTLRITDDLSGPYDAWWSLESPSGAQTTYGSLYYWSRISGNDLDGVYRDSRTRFKQYDTENGTWHINYLCIEDRSNNRNEKCLSETDLKARGFITEIEVTGSVPDPDTTPPDLLEMDFNPKSVDLSTGDRYVTFTLRITDDLSGPYDAWWSLKSPSGAQTTYGSLYYWSRISGNDLDGVYRDSRTRFKQYDTENGTWHITYLCIEDRSNNRNKKCLSEADLKARGFITETKVGGCDTASSELCGDKIDNDCDSQIDEGFDVGNVCLVGVGACQRSGTNICSADGTGTKCSAVAGTPTTEVCDGIDNNCDGQTDEGFDLGTICLVGVGACQASGEKVCTADKSGTECNAVAGTPTTELCGDSIDNDCDGETDEALHGGRCKSPAEAKNNAPVADAGADIVCDGTNDVAEGETILLDGLCTDADASDLLTGTWTQNVGGTTCGTINNASDTGGGPLAVTADCIAPDVSANENESFQLECNDTITSAVDNVTVCVNAKPSALPQSVSTKEDTDVTITLTGSDPNNEALSYTVLSHPTHGDLSGDPPALAYTPFANYNGADSFTFNVHDGIQAGNSAAVSISVGSINDIPIACAGADQTVIPPVSVVLDGTCSSDTEGDSLTFKWNQVSGEAVALSNTTTTQPTFSPTKAGTYIFQLVVNDGIIDSNPDSVNITVNNVPPEADPGEDQLVYPGGSVALACHGTDANEDPLSYFWTQISGPLFSTKFPVKTSEWSAAAPNVAAESAVLLSCTVSDGVGGFDSGTVTVTVKPPASPEKYFSTPTTTSSEEEKIVDSSTGDEEAPEVIIEIGGQTWTITLDEGDIALPTRFADSSDGTLKISWEAVSGPDMLVIEGNRINTADYVYKSGSYQIREKEIDEGGGIHYSEPVTITMPNNPPEPPLPEEFDFGRGAERISHETSDGKMRFTYDGYSNVISFNSIFTDPDDDQLTYHWSADDEGLELVVGETGEVTLWNRKAGTRKIVVAVEDGQGGKTEETIEFYIPPPELTADEASLYVTGRTATGEGRQTVSGLVESPVIPIVRLNGVTARVTLVESGSSSLSTGGVMALAVDPAVLDTYRFVAEGVPGLEGLEIEVLTDVNGEAVSLFSKSMAAETGDEEGGGETPAGHSPAAGGCSLVR